MRKKTYTKEEDEIIIGQIKNYPTNLQHAFMEASSLLVNRDAKAISQRYYKRIKKDINTYALTCGSTKGFTQNVKNKFRDSDGTLPEQNLKHYMVIMKELLELQPQERQLIVNFFSGNNQINQ